MPATQIAVTPENSAAATALLTQSVPVAGEARVIGGVTSVLQKLLNLASVASRLILGGNIGDPGGGDAGNTVVWWTNQAFAKGALVNVSLIAQALFQANNGRVILGVSLVLPASGAITLSPLDARFYYQPTSSAAQSATIDDTNCVDDDEFEILLAPAANSNLTVYAPDGTTILTVLYGTQAAHSNHARFRRKSGTWHAIQGILNSDRTV